VAVEFICGDATAIPFPPAHFNAVVALESAFHIAPSRELFLAEAARVLKPCGVYTASDILLPVSFYQLRQRLDPTEVCLCCVCLSTHPHAQRHAHTRIGVTVVN
jgi:ubiquinone/menaquinone biosynthesis C-methylase UbiE